MFPSSAWSTHVEDVELLCNHVLVTPTALSFWLRVRAVIVALRMETSLRTPCTSAGLPFLPIRWRRRLRNRRHLIATALCIAVLLTYTQIFLAVGRHPRSAAVDVANTANLVDYVGAHLNVQCHTTLPR